MDGEFGAESHNSLTIAETYSDGIYGWFGVENNHSEGKRNHAARKSEAAKIFNWAEKKRLPSVAVLETS